MVKYDKDDRRTGRDHRAAADGRVTPKKSLGQHFLKDRNIAAKIAHSVSGSSGPDPATVLEVGCGTGILTGLLLDREDINLYGVEVDRESIDYLRRNYPQWAQTKLIHGDFLNMDLAGTFGRYLNIIGNFPYNISSQIFFKVIENRDIVGEAVGMIQREVALRITAPPGSKTYGILSVLIQAWYDVEYLFTVNENVFDPPPKVKSAVIRLRRNKTDSLACDESLFVRTVKAAFGQRRKMLRNSLRAVFPTLPEDDGRFFTLRAERLTVDDFVDLTNWIDSNSR